jgi:hypothetical protein
MKSLSLMLVITLLSSGCAVAGLPKAKITYRVVDQEGNPIVGAHVDVGFVEASGRSVTGFTDTNGIFVAEDISSGGAGSLVKKEGFYWGGGGCSYTNLNKLLHRFEPWNPTVEVVMKEIRNPVSMVQIDGRKRFKCPAYNKSLGFDFEKGDWVAPYGVGRTTDMILTYTPFENVITGGTCRISFTNEFDGIMEYPFDPQDRSWFKWPYDAPEAGYTNSLSRYYKAYDYELNYSELYPNDAYFKNKPIHRGVKREDNAKEDEEINYIFRVRSVIDEDGNLVKACYGKIQGEIHIGWANTLRLKYWFNPHWTRNLEDDPKRNVRLD